MMNLIIKWLMKHTHFIISFNFYIYCFSCKVHVNNFYRSGKKCISIMLSKHNSVIIIELHSNILTLLQLIYRDEYNCIKMFSLQLIHREDFRELVMEDASEIKMRQETDSIGIIDDIRFHLTNFVQTYSEMEEANERLRMVDDLLEDMNLDG